MALGKTSSLNFLLINSYYILKLHFLLRNNMYKNVSLQFLECGGEKNCKFLNYPYHSHTKVYINNVHTLCWGFGEYFLSKVQKL